MTAVVLVTAGVSVSPLAKSFEEVHDAREDFGRQLVDRSADVHRLNTFGLRAHCEAALPGFFARVKRFLSFEMHVEPLRGNEKSAGP